MGVILICAPIWVVDTLWPCNEPDFDAAVLNPSTGEPGIAFQHEDTLFIAEYSPGTWVLDTVGVFYKLSEPALAYDPDGAPHVAFISDTSAMHMQRDVGVWTGGVVDDPDSSERHHTYKISLSIRSFPTKIIVVVYNRFGWDGSGSVSAYTWTGSKWSFEYLVRGYIMLNPDSMWQGQYVEIWDPSPITVYSGSFDFIYRYEFYDNWYLDTSYWQIRNRYGVVYEREAYSCKDLNMIGNYWCWFKDGVTWVTNDWHLPIAGADLDVLSSGTLIAAGRAGSAAYLRVYSYEDFWWYEGIPGESTSGKVSVATTPDDRIFVAYMGKDSLLHVARKLYTGADEATSPESPGLLGRTVFARGDDVVLDGLTDIRVYDLSGRALISGKFESFNTSSMMPGVYLIEFVGVGRQPFVVVD